jgi:hypothetical protein
VPWHHGDTDRSLAVGTDKPGRFFDGRDVGMPEGMVDEVVELMVSWSPARAPFTGEAVQSGDRSVYGGPTSALMGLTTMETQPQADSHLDCLVIQVETACRDWQGVEPVAAVWGP